MIFGGLLLLLAGYQAIRMTAEFTAGIVALKFKWTYPKLEAGRTDDPVGFWLLISVKLMIVVALAYVGGSMVVD